MLKKVINFFLTKITPSSSYNYYELVPREGDDSRSECAV